MVAGWDAGTGKLLWRTSEPAEPPFYSAASSPVGENGIILAHPGNYDPLTAFDANTGEVRWRGGAGGFFASPIIATLDGVRQVVTMTQKNVLGISVTNGQVLWEFPWSGASGGPMPVLYGDVADRKSVV